MAGKTLLGIGNEARQGAAADDAPPVAGVDEASTVPVIIARMSSEPTIVDDEKVREGLRRLSSLDSSSNEPFDRDDAAPNTEPHASPIADVAAAAAARSLDGMVPLPEASSGPRAAPGAGLVPRPQTGGDRGTLLGREVHLAPEFGARRDAAETSPRRDRLTPSQRPVVKVPRPPVSRNARSRTPSRPAVGEETVQLRGRPNLAARVTIVLATAAAVALLGVAGLRWQQEGDAPAAHHASTPEWPSSEGPSPHEAAEAPLEPPAAPARVAPAAPAAVTSARRPSTDLEEPAVARAQAFPVAPSAAAAKASPSHADAVENKRPRPEAPPRDIVRIAGGGTDTHGDGAHASRPKDKTPSGSPARPSVVKVEGRPESKTEGRAEIAAPQPPPFRTGARKDDPDSTLPLDVE